MKKILYIATTVLLVASINAQETIKDSSLFKSFTNDIYKKTFHYRNMSVDNLCEGKVILLNEVSTNGTGRLVAKSENGQFEKVLFSKHKISRIEVVDAQTNGYWLQISSSGLPVFYTGEEKGKGEGLFVQFHTNGFLRTAAIMTKGKLKRYENWNIKGVLENAKEYIEPVALEIGDPKNNKVKKSK